MVEAAIPEGSGSTTENNHAQDPPNITDNSMGNNQTSETMANYNEERKGNESQSPLGTEDGMVASTKTLAESNNKSAPMDRNRILK